MKSSRRIFSIFKVRQYANLPEVSPPVYMISVFLALAGFVAYIFGGVAIEQTLRYSSLAGSTCAIAILFLHLVHPRLARWSAGLFTTLLVFALAEIWNAPYVLILLAIPVFLTTALVNVPAAALTAGLQTVALFSLEAGAALDPAYRGLLVLSVWLAAFISGGSYYFIERLLLRASDDYTRLQELLYQSRDQQQRLSTALDDLEHANRQLSLLYDKNISLRKSAEEATEAKSTYIARVSHEIRTPLNMILGITESIIENQEAYEDDLPLDLVDDIKVIRRNSEHLLSLVNDVLDLTRAETSRLVLRREWTDLVQEVETSLEIVQPLAKKKKLNLCARIAGPLPEVYCDRTRIRQVILNLLSNAVRYTEQGEVCVLAHAEDAWLVVEVRDTGPGVQIGDQDRIFEPFYRGDAGVRQETVGTGLGLSVCRQLVDLHGGKVWLESRPRQGSSFFFRLPLALAGEAGASPARFISEQWAWVERKRERSYHFDTPEKKRVLALGTNEVLPPDAAPLREQMEIVEVDSLAGLAAKAAEAPAHLAVINAASVEALLPAMAQAAAELQDTPIIGSIFHSMYERLYQAGALDYVQKPFSNRRLRQAVQQIQPYPRRILIVDDNTDVQRLIVRILSSENEDTQYLLAENGPSGLEVARRKKPDLILLDLALPGMDGWQVLKAFKEDPALGQTPVILVSAHDLNETPARSRAVVLMNGEGISLERFYNLLRAGVG